MLEFVKELTLSQVGWYLLYLFLALYIPEFIADRLAWAHLRPSWVLVKIAAWATDAAMALGRFIGWISSFVDYLRLEMFYVPLFKLLKPTYDLCISWLWIFTGYIDFAEKFKRTGIVYWGSYLILVATWIFIKYCWCMYQGIAENNWISNILFGMLMGTITYMVIGLVYYGGNAIHEFIKTIWNVVNRDNILLVGRSNVPKKADVVPPTDDAVGEQKDKDSGSSRSNVPKKATVVTLVNDVVEEQKDKDSGSTHKKKK